MSKFDSQGNKERKVNKEVIEQTIQFPTFNKKKGRDFLGRLIQFHNYVDIVIRDQLFLYNRVMLSGPATDVLAQDDNKNIHYGVNYASADYLGMAQHPNAKKAAIEAIQKYGISSGNSPRGLGSHNLYLQLQKQLEEYWDMHMLIYSTGWMGGFGILNTLIKPWDHIVMDYVSHNCLQEGAISATRNIKRFQHLNHQEMTRMLKQTRQADPDNAIIVVTEGLFSMDADSPDLKLYQRTAKKYNAYLLIDCAHDFGHLGPTGKGAWQAQGLTDFSNVIMCGTGSKTLSTNIGFIGAKDKKLIDLMRYMSNSYSNATCINPVQAATSLAQLNILRNQEGAQRRKKVTQNYKYIKGILTQKGHTIIGNPCAIMPVLIGNEVISRLVCRIMMDKGVHVNGIEYPVVGIGQARLRVSLLPQHTKEHLDRFIQVYEESMEKAKEIFDKSMLNPTEETHQNLTPKL